MDEANEKLSQTLNKKKTIKDRMFLISNIALTVIFVIIAIILAIYVVQKYKNNGLDQEIVDDENGKKIKVLSEDIVWTSRYEFKDIAELTDNIRKTYKDGSGLIKGNNIYIKEGMYEFELKGEKYGLIFLSDKFEELKLSVNFDVDDGNGGSFTKITEVYLTPGMILEVKPDQRQTSEAISVRIHIRRLSKDLEQTSVKEGKSYEFKEKSSQEFYRVGKDIPAGIYDVELVAGKGGLVRIHEKEKVSQQSFRPSNFQKILVSLNNNEKLFKDIPLNKGDRIFLINVGNSTNNSNPSKYKFTAK